MSRGVRPSATKVELNVTKIKDLGTNIILVGLLSAITLNLQGCDVPRVEGFYDLGSLSFPTHAIPNWRTKINYYDIFAHEDPITHQLRFNSCNDKNVPAQSVCSGHGVCAPWDRDDIENPYFFCQCYDAWADPECTTKRRSQFYAWWLSMFLGWCGADEFYLGNVVSAAVKCVPPMLSIVLWMFKQRELSMLLLFPLWVIDIVRIGSAPVQAKRFLVEPDLPRWAFQVFTMMFLVLLGFILGVASIFHTVRARRRNKERIKHMGFDGMHIA